MRKNTKIGRRHRANKKILPALAFIAFIFSILTVMLPGVSIEAARRDTLAVVPFHVIGQTNRPETLSHGLPELISGYLSKIPEFTVVDRIRLAEVIQELKLGQAGLVDEKLAGRAGALIPASLIIIGTAQVEGSDVHVQVQGIRVVTGVLGFSVEATGKTNRMKDLSALGRLVATRVAGVIHPEFRELEGLTGLTDSNLSFTDFSLGLSRLDEGRVDEAKVLFDSSRQKDGHFLWPLILSERSEKAFRELEREVRKIEKN
jgi:TolB-like protein